MYVCIRLSRRIRETGQIFTYHDNEKVTLRPVVRDFRLKLTLRPDVRERSQCFGLPGGAHSCLEHEAERLLCLLLIYKETKRQLHAGLFDD